MSLRIFVCVMTAKTFEGETALKRSFSAQVSGAFKKAMNALGLHESRRVVSEMPYILEIEFKLTKATGMAYSSARKNSFKRWVEDFDSKLDEFDKAEEVHRDTDYVVEWEDRTL